MPKAISTTPALFARDKACEACDLHEAPGNNNTCIPMRPLHHIAYARDGDMVSRVDLTPALPVEVKSIAVLIIGEAPGYQEDRTDQCFSPAPMGQPMNAGAVLETAYVDGAGLPKLADVYACNLVRCRPPSNNKPTAKQLKACRGYLHADLLALRARYKRLYLLLVGALPIREILGSSLTEATKHQGLPIAILHPLLREAEKAVQTMEAYRQSHPDDDEATITQRTLELRLLRTAKSTIETEGIFSTYHPAYLLPGRNPSAINSVEDHLAALTRTLRGYIPATPPTLDDITIDPQPHSYSDPKGSVPSPARHAPISIDTETYGILEGQEQTRFHPIESRIIDNVPYKKQIVTVQITYRTCAARKVHLVFRIQRPGVLKRLILFLTAAKVAECPLAGQNITFDLMYLRAHDPHLARLLQPFSWLLIDTAVLSYLDNEARPERSLKNIAPIYGLPSYDDIQQESFADDNDPLLYVYGIRDTWSVHELLDRIPEYIRQRYSEETAERKLSPETRKYYSDILWCVLEMQEAGVYYNGTQMRANYATISARMTEVQASTDLKLSGKNSQKEQDALILEISQSDYIPHDVRSQLTRSPATKKISNDKVNLALLIEALKQHDRILPAARGAYIDELEGIQKFKRLAKLASSYYEPRLGITPEGKKEKDSSARMIPPTLRGKRHRIQDVLVAYPNWFPVPMASKGDDKEGGIQQGRIVPVQPALATDPEEVQDCMLSRFKCGVLLSYDLSQIEYRMAGMLSGEPTILEAYAQGADFHATMGGTLYHKVLGADVVPWDDLPAGSIYDEWRDVGKHANFLIVFLGGGYKLAETITRLTGLSVSPNTTDRIVKEQRELRKALAAWQQDLIEQATEIGYIELPLLGHSRLFNSVTKKDHSTIVNVPVQCSAAVLFLHSQAQVQREITQRSLSSRVVLNVYDSVKIDAPLYEESIVDEIVERAIAKNTYMARLAKCLGRDPVPLVYDKTRKEFTR